MGAKKACREVAASTPDDELVTALTVLGPDSPLLPAVRDEVRRRLAAANDAATRPTRSLEGEPHAQ